jgi:hypothetical protein
MILQNKVNSKVEYATPYCPSNWRNNAYTTANSGFYTVNTDTQNKTKIGLNRAY